MANDKWVEWKQHLIECADCTSGQTCLRGRIILNSSSPDDAPWLTERPSAEQLAEIRKADESYGHAIDLDIRLLAESISCPAIEHRRLLLNELDAVTREKDEALAQRDEYWNRWNACVGLAGMNFITNRERGSK